MHISIELYIYIYVPKGLVTDEICWKRVKIPWRNGHVSKYLRKPTSSKHFLMLYPNTKNVYLVIAVGKGKTNKNDMP